MVERATKQTDEFGQVYYTLDDLFDLCYENPNIDFTKMIVKDPEEYNRVVEQFYYELPLLQKYVKSEKSVEQYDKDNQSDWYIPEKYKSLDIVEWVLLQCNTEAERQRVAEELFLFEQRNMLSLLNVLKYLVDTFRENNVIWGVGRGSSVASYVLFLIGIHKIDSLFYDLNIKEFLR